MMGFEVCKAYWICFGVGSAGRRLLMNWTVTQLGKSGTGTNFVNSRSERGLAHQHPASRVLNTFGPKKPLFTQAIYNID